MKPLQGIAVGYVLTALYARVHGYDVLADPLGWLIVLAAVRRLPADFARSTLLYVAGVAFLVSLPLWVPAVTNILDDADPSIPWALSLPALGFCGLLSHELVAVSRTAGERTAPHVFQGLVTVTAVVAVLPVLVFGGHVTGLDGTATAVSGLLPIVLFMVLVTYSSRPWARAPITETATKHAPSS